MRRRAFLAVLPALALPSAVPPPDVVAALDVQADGVRVGLFPSDLSPEWRRLLFELAQLRREIEPLKRAAERWEAARRVAEAAPRSAEGSPT